MGRPQKEKNNYEKRFEQLYAEKGINGNAGLLKKMYTVYYKGKPDVSTDRQTWVNSQAPDLGKKIRGERAFTETDKKAIERALDMSWVDIVEPLPEKKKEKKFEERGLRYAAYMDEERYYQDLAECYNADEYNVALCNYDEYGKTIVDYIIENKAKKGLEFLIDKEYICCNGSLQFGGKIYRSEEHSKELWDLIIDLDDPKLFLKVLGKKNLFDFSFYCEEDGEKFLEKIIKSEKILQAMCEEHKYYNENNEKKYMSILLFETLKFALNRNKQVVARRIISAYTKFIENQRVAFQNEINQESNNKLMARHNGHSAQIEIIHGESLVMYVWDFSKLSKKYIDFDDQIEPLQIPNIINRLEVKNLSAMEYGDSFVKDGIYYIKKEFDLSLEALKYLTEERECKFLPTYMGEENGVTKISAYKNDRYCVEFSELGKMLGEIHLLSQEKLGADKVYMYSIGFANGFGRMLSGGTQVITSWKTCDKGTPILDIVTAFLNFGDAHGYYGKVYRRFIEDKDKSYQELSQFLNVYPDKRIIENFGDKFNEELDRMLKNEIQSAQGKNTETIEKLYMAKSFAEIYRDKLNLKTNQSCEGEDDKK